MEIEEEIVSLEELMIVEEVPEDELSPCSLSVLYLEIE